MGFGGGDYSRRIAEWAVMAGVAKALPPIMFRIPLIGVTNENVYVMSTVASWPRGPWMLPVVMLNTPALSSMAHELAGGGLPAPLQKLL